ncbi:N-acetyltransferase [Actinorhabdospora filicis]|uniref:N-acetyltransferase n=1 Tax=Actinorhabdospora filicis TaxID=1785913 RepID=A0A9W6WBP7_9ACTN|nr:GNAT family N-acetyltransferase [Actinorhabdospora filicis]GLZ80839.1 N-acetyltransferase [Actinorhabdospora filicis]
MIEARRATLDDVAELVRLRAVMQSAINGEPAPPGPWMDTSASVLCARFAEPEPTLAAFVVERPGDPGHLASCAVGTIEQRLAAPDNPSGRVGYLFSVATDEDMRRRGYSRACVSALLDWYRERGVTKVDLRASVDAEPLYRSLGFIRTADPAMRLSM